MRIKDISVEEIFIGAMLQFPLYFIVGWWVIPIQFVCGILWAIGGAEGGTKLARRIGVPLVVCTSTFVVLHQWTIFLAIPFMIWFAPSYGASTPLFKFWNKLTGNHKKADLLTRGSNYIFYWLTFVIALLLN